MVRKSFLQGIQIAVIVLWISNCGGSVNSNSGKIIKLSYNCCLPSTHHQYQFVENWCKEIEKRTKGHVAISLVSNVAVAKPDQVYEDIVTGKADIGMSYFAYNPQRFPLLSGLDLPVGYPAGLAATKIANYLAKKYHPEEISDVHLLYIHAHGSGVLASRNRIKTMNDLKNLKIGTFGSSLKIASLLGASPINVNFPVPEDTLNNNIIKAIFCPIETVKNLKQAELIRYVVDTPAAGCTAAMFVVMNKTKWNALPVDIQHIISKVNEEWIIKQGKAWDRADKEGWDYIKKAGCEIVQLPAEEQKKWITVVSPLLDEYITQTEGNGLPGEDFLNDLKKLVGDYKE